MPPNYGEGSYAFLRLQKILLSEDSGMTVLAWDSQDLAQSACLLAPSLACFRESGDIEAQLSSLTTAEYSFTNIGLSGYYPVILRPNAAGEHMFTPLHCYRRDRPLEIITLSLGALHTNSGRGGSVECYVSPTEYSNVRRRTGATRLAVVNPSQQSLMINITIRSSLADIARISRGINHVVERSSDDKASKPSRHGSGEALLLPVTIPPKDELNPVRRLVDGSDRFAGDLYKAIGHSLVAFIGAAMSETTNVGIDTNNGFSVATSTALESEPTMQQPLQSVPTGQMSSKHSTNGLHTTTMTQLQGAGAVQVPVNLPGSLYVQKSTINYEPDAAFFHHLPSYLRAPVPDAARTMPMFQAQYGGSSSGLAQSHSDKDSPTPSWHTLSATGRGEKIGPPTIAPFKQRRSGSTLAKYTRTSAVDVRRPANTRDLDHAEQITDSNLIRRRFVPTTLRNDTTGDQGLIPRPFVSGAKRFSNSAEYYWYFVIFGNAVYSKVRRFVVVREAEHFCSALPITNYGSRGVSKVGTKKSEHSIIHTGRLPPQPTPGERPSRDEHGMRSRAIRVNPDRPDKQLDAMSRLDYAKVHTIQHNIKVAPVGVVHPDSMAALLSQFQEVWNESAGKGKANAIPRIMTKGLAPGHARPIASVLRSDGEPVGNIRAMMHRLTNEGRSQAEAIDEVIQNSTATGIQSEYIMTLVLAALMSPAPAVLSTGGAGKVSVGAVAKQEESSAEESMDGSDVEHES
ncbi:hypothetical protein LTR10_011093 [Elasticomyces elasticus]|nr:hypothetical protein LTR10_011093 [Elasticomyces elasticus]